MSLCHTVTLGDLTPTPWRNGGGLTRELLAWPRPEAWQLRVSVAHIARSGRFSAFEGVQRWFAVLEGAGVTLELPQGARALVPGDAPLAFDGEAAPMCHLLEGPTEDLNLMVRRGAGVARMARAEPGSRVEGPARWRGLFAAGPALLAIDDHTEALPAGTLAWSDAQDAACWTLQPRSAGPAFWLLLED